MTKTLKKGQIVRWTNNGSSVVHEGEIIQIRKTEMVVAFKENEMTLWKVFLIK